MSSEDTHSSARPSRAPAGPPPQAQTANVAAQRAAVKLAKEAADGYFESAMAKPKYDQEVSD